MGEWMYRSTFLYLGTSWKLVVSFTVLAPLSICKEIGGLVDPRADLNDMEEIIFLTLP
jgi:hypothetical protein